VNLAALWHDLECADYREDLPVWRALAAETGGPVLDVGAGTGRVTLDLAARGVEVVALDRDPRLLAALARRANGAPVATVTADARRFSLGRRFPLIVVPMQTLQMLGGRQGRGEFLRCALAHLAPGGLLAVALGDAVDCFDDEHVLPPPPTVRDVAGVRYASRLLAADDEGDRAALRRRREVIGPDGHRSAEDSVVRLDRVAPDAVATEARAIGFAVAPHRSVPETERYLGSVVVVLSRPGGRPRPADRP